MRHRAGKLPPAVYVLDTQRKAVVKVSEIVSKEEDVCVSACVYVCGCVCVCVCGCLALVVDRSRHFVRFVIRE